MVLLVPIGIGESKVADGPVKGVRLAEIAAEQRRMPGLRVGAGECPAVRQSRGSRAAAMRVWPPLWR